MLQIISGKFFKSAKRYRYDGKGILYGNFQWYEAIETCAAKLEPVDIFGSVASYVVSYVNQIEKVDEARRGTLIRTGDSEIVEQFRLLCVVGLQSFFHSTQEIVAIACRQRPLSMSDLAPQVFVPRHFQASVKGTAEDVAFFSQLVKKVIGLPRDTYRAVLAALKGFADALEVCGENIDLSYSLLVFALECLSQTFDCYEPEWADYPPEVTVNLNPILEQLPEGTSEDIRLALLRERNLKLGKRFVDFALDHIDRRLFMQEAPNMPNALRKSDLARALRNAYGLRSKYTHELRPIHELLRTPGFARGEVLNWEHEPYPTLAGLVRVVRHVICNFVSRQELLKTEDIDWRSELPGIVRAHLAPQYWIWRHEDFQVGDATRRLEGFLQQVESTFANEVPLTGLRDLMTVYEKHIPDSHGQEKLRMFALYCAYNLIVADAGRTDDHEEFIAKHEVLLEECSIETMLVLLVLVNKWPWKPKEVVGQWNLYRKQRYQRRGLVVPRALEVLVQVRIAEAYLEAGSTQRHSMWLGRALDDAAGRPSLQEAIRKARLDREPIPHGSFWETVGKDTPKKE